MKVLHIGKYFPPYAGGMETYLRDLMAAHSEQGLECRALVHQSNLGLRSTDESYQAGSQQLPITRAAVWARLLFTPISPTFPWLLNRLLKETQPDILHLHMPNVSVFWALLLPRARKLPWVVQWQSDVLASQHSLGLRLFYGLYRPFERAVLKKAAAIIASSPPYMASSEPLQPYQHKCSVIPLGIAPPAGQPEFQPTDTRNSTSKPTALRVLAVGRLTYYKGFETLLRAIALVPGVQLNLVGTGEMREKLESIIDDLAIADRVNLLGHLTDTELDAQWHETDCLCLPSIERTEAYGLVLLEAMCRGKATIAAEVPGSGMGWIVQTNETGLTTTPGNPDSLADAMRNLGLERDKLHALGENGKTRFNQLFHIDKSAGETRTLYGRLLDQN